MTSASNTFSLNHVSLVSGSLHRLQDVSLNIPTGRTAIVGFSGAGKSSLLSLLAGFEPASTGTIQQTDVDSRYRMPTFWAPQDNGLWPSLTVREHLSAVARPDQNSQRENHGRAKKAGSIDKSLEAFDLLHRESAYVGQLSKGEQNRLAVLRCLIANPGMILLDEPLIHVDPKRQPVYWNLIEKHLQESGANLIFATHQPDIAISHSDWCLCLKNGQLDWMGKTTDLYHSAPDQQTAEYLGPNNWFTETEVRSFFDLARGFISCRPEELRLTKCETSSLQIVGTAFGGSYAVTSLRHTGHDLTKDVIHRPHGNVFEIGQFVSLEVL